MNTDGEVIAIEVREDEEEVAIECNSIGVFGLTEIGKPNNQPSTLRMEGKMVGVSVQVLVDSGASHNFIAPQVATALGLLVEQDKSLGVRLGDGHRVSTVGKCSGIEVQLGNFTTLIDAYVLELDDLDLILGAAWMKRFGRVIFDWDEMSLSFLWKGETVVLQGLNTKYEPSQTSSLHSLLQEEGAGVEVVKDIGLAVE